MREKIKGNKLIISLLIIIYFILIYIVSINYEIQNPNLIGAIAIGIITLFANYKIVNEAKINKQIDYKTIIIAIIVVGIILRTVYILYTPITERQHDMEDDVGHMAYIETIYKTGKLPVSNEWQFYHQPLHHGIAAGWLKINEIFGVDLSTAEEGIQILTAIYSSMILIITYCILSEMNFKDAYKTIILLVIALHPTFILLSGSVNNDILLTMITFLDLLYIIKWNKNQSFKNTIILALLTALTALTKISGTIIAIPILYVFLKKFIEEIKLDKKKIKSYIAKFAVFGVISLGIGLLYSIRNMILFNQSLFYVPTPGDVTYCGDVPLIKRLNIFSKEWLDPYCHPFENSNVFAYLIKSSLFGEYYIKQMPANKLASVGLSILAYLMIILNIIIVVISIINIVKILLGNGKKDTIINMLMAFYITEMLMYIYGNITKPFACTMDFRYIVPTVFLGMVFIVNNFERQPKRCVNVTNIFIIMFSVISVIYELVRNEFAFNIISLKEKYFITMCAIERSKKRMVFFMRKARTVVKI